MAKAKSKKTKIVGVIQQCRNAFGSPIALVVGAVLGGVVALASFIIKHCEKPELWSLKSLFVVAALMFSAKSVYQWTYSAFQDDWFKAAGWVVLVEGCMLISDTAWLTYLMLGLLIIINSIATGCNLAMQDLAQKPKAKKLGRVNLSGEVANNNAKRAARVA